MAKPNEVHDRMTSAKQGPAFTIPLDQIKQMPGEYRHRAEADLDKDKESMKALMRSLIVEGQKDPVLVYRDVVKAGTESSSGWPGTGVPGFQTPGGKRTNLTSR